jgi:pyruvate dehydrogenase E2 component (dihydrolipoamide acetyltransferase)
MDFLVPKLSATMEEAKVLRWLKRPGEAVRSGEPLVELETDKAAMEVESPVDGVLGAILVAEGEDATVGAKLAEIGEAHGAARSASTGSGGAMPAPSPAQVPAKPAPAPPADEALPARILASPLARRLARERSVDLAALAARKRGRVRKADVLAAAAAPPVAARPEAGPPGPPIPAEPAATPLTPMRARIAATVAESRRTIPAFTLDRLVSTEAIARARVGLGAAVERDAGVRLTLTDFILQALADVLGQNPVMRERFAEAAGGPGSIRHERVDIGLVVAVEGGLMIPVLADLAGRSLAEIGRARRDAVQRVRAGRLVAGDAAPVPIALSNLSRSGADRFEAIIGPGQSSVLAVGREHEAVIARGGVPAVVTGVHLTLSVDHRLIDGLTAATFLGHLAERIEFGPWQA